jgi:hypothetical protein
MMVAGTLVLLGGLISSVPFLQQRPPTMIPAIPTAAPIAPANPPAPEEKTPSVIDFSAAAYNGWSPKQRFNFIMERLNEREQALKNFSCEYIYHCENIFNADGQIEYQTNGDFTCRRMNEKLWWEMITHAVREIKRSSEAYSFGMAKSSVICSIIIR